VTHTQPKIIHNHHHYPHQICKAFKIN